MITELLPASIDPAIYDECFKPLDRKLSPVVNRTVMAQIQPGFRYYCGTTDTCDCGTVIGSMNQSEKKTFNPKTKLKKLRKKKWSEEKIKSALAKEWNNHNQHMHDSNQAHIAIGEKWLFCIQEFLEKSRAERMGLLWHWYQGRLEDERIVIHGCQDVRVGATSLEALMRFAQDTVYWFRL